jgi:hypothetical protein
MPRLVASGASEVARALEAGRMGTDEIILAVVVDVATNNCHCRNVSCSLLLA